MMRVMASLSPSPTIPDLFAQTVAARRDEPALGFILDGQLKWLTWHQVDAEARRLAAAVLAAGVEPGDRVAHVAENRREWVITDLALHLAGAVQVPIHVSLSGAQIAEQIADSGAKLAFVSTAELVGKVVESVGKTVPFVVCEGTAFVGNDELGVQLLRDFIAGVGDNTTETLADVQSSSDELATILYTSGTTGVPRGVMLSQENLAGNAVAVTDTVGGDVRETRLCFLPLSHIYARTCDLYTWVYLGSRLAIAESRETILRDCQLVRPSVINGVPYFYQKVCDRVRAAGVDDETAALHKALGENLHRCFCGGAAISPGVEQWFAERGLPILAGYGLTETSPVVATQTSSAQRAGTVGRPLPGVDVRIADDCEILVRGPNVMLGYWQDDAATHDVVRDGWFHTGDLGGVDEDGYLAIGGRKKEICVLSTGKNVAPTWIESLLSASPFIEQVAVVGDGRSHLAALIVPCADVLRAEIRSRRICVWSRRRALRHPRVREIYAAEVARLLAGCAQEEQVHAFALLGRGFEVERGELTPKLSLRRNVIAEHFRDEIEAMYRDTQRPLASA